MTYDFPKLTEDKTARKPTKVIAGQDIRNSEKLSSSKVARTLMINNSSFKQFNQSSLWHEMELRRSYYLINSNFRQHDFCSSM